MRGWTSWAMASSRASTFVHGFLEQVEGIDFEHKVKMGIRDNRYDAMVPQVVAPLTPQRAASMPSKRNWRGAHTKQEAEVHSARGPMTIVDTVADRFYGDKRQDGFCLCRAAESGGAGAAG
jgi:5-methyltetrahydropteroyltriglutamate--homocysteine methyltransferase